MHDNIHIKDIHILLRKSKSSKREMNGTSAWHTKLRLSQFILSSSGFMKFSFSFSLVKVLHRMFYTICSVFNLSMLTFTNTSTQTSFEFGFVLFSSSNKFFQVHFPHFVFVLFQLIFYIFLFYLSFLLQIF